MQSVATNHALADGNKRTAWVAARLFYGMNDYRITATEDERFDLIIAVPTRQLDTVERPLPGSHTSRRQPEHWTGVEPEESVLQKAVADRLGECGTETTVIERNRQQRIVRRDRRTAILIPGRNSGPWPEHRLEQLQAGVNQHGSG